MLSQMTGPISAFSGPTANTVTRIATAIEIVEEATFEELVLQFPAEHTDEADITDLIFPPTFRILNVESFKLATGSILVSFRV